MGERGRFAQTNFPSGRTEWGFLLITQNQVPSDHTESVSSDHTESEVSVQSHRIRGSYLIA